MRTRLSLIVLILLLSGFTPQVNSIPTEPVKWELDCENIDCKGTLWGATDSVEIPYSSGVGSPACTVKVFFKKRLCGTKKDMKILGFESTGCFDFSSYDAFSIVFGKIWNENNYFGILPDYAANGEQEVRIFRPTCMALILIDGKKVYIPCEKACCISALTVWKNDCGRYDGLHFYTENAGVLSPPQPWCATSELDNTPEKRYLKTKFREIFNDKKLDWIKIQYQEAIAADTANFEILRGCEFICNETPDKMKLKDGSFYQ